MPPKKKVNGYFMFMQEERQRIQAETKMTPSMQDLASLCTESWKNLSMKEKAKYNSMAKKVQGEDSQDKDRHRLNNQGQIIAERKQIAKEAEYRRIQENQFLVKSWAGKDILDVQFHIINFQVMYIEESADFFLPQEVGLVSFTLRDGIIKQMHHFIDPGDVPQGNMHLALRHSENTHKIPLHFEKADSNFFALWNQMERFVVNDHQRDEIPPVFCLMNERNIFESCLEYIHYHARTGEPSRLKIYTLEDLVMSLLLQSGKINHRPSETQIQDCLLRNDWDYTCSIRCSYHDDVDSPYCSLAIVKRLSFALFDMLSITLGFNLTAQHKPEEISDNKYTVLHPTTFNEASRRDAYHSQRDKDTNRSSSSSTSSPSNVRHKASSPDHIPRMVLGASRFNQAEITSYSESDEETDEIKSTTDQHFLAELRKPNTPAMTLSQPLPSTGMSFGRGLVRPAGRGFSSVVTNEPVRHFNPMRPPPGLVARPGMVAGTMPQPQSFTRPTTNNVWTQPRVTQPATSSTANRGWEMGRGRGLARQM